LHYFFYNNIHNNNDYCNYYIADHAAAAAAAADDANDDDDVGNADGDSFKFQMLSINILTMILMSNMFTTTITHMPALAFSRLPLQGRMDPSTQVCCQRSCRSCKTPRRVQG
jgi:hypothetical protein